MAIIIEFTTDPFLEEFSDQHHSWHSGDHVPEFPLRTIPKGQAGSGLEFLEFHKLAVDIFSTWNSQHSNTYDITPWINVPDFLKKNKYDWGWSNKNELKKSSNTIKNFPH